MFFHDGVLQYEIEADNPNTQFAKNARIFKDALLMKPKEVAEAGYEALMNGERVIIPGMSNI